MGAWGHGPLDNDDASDWKWDIGKAIIDKILERLESDNVWNQYYAIGMWDFVRHRLYTQYYFFTGDITDNMNEKCRKAAKKIYEDRTLIEAYSNPNRVIDYLTPWLDDEIHIDDQIKANIVKSYVDAVSHLDRVEIIDSEESRANIKVVDGTCYNRYKIWLANDMIVINDVAIHKFDEPFFTDNIANPESQKKFAEKLIKRHNLK